MFNKQTLINILSPDSGHIREHNGTHTSLGFGEIHIALIQNLRPTNALVLGSRYGFIPGCIAAAMAEIGHGHIDFVDANYNDTVHGEGIAYGGVGAWTDPMTRFTTLGLQNRITTYICRTDQYWPDCQTMYDYIYFDANHSYRGIYEDFVNSGKNRHTKTWLVFHDSLVDHPNFGVKLFLEMFREQLFDVFETLTIPIWPGLTIVRQKEISESD